MGKKIFKLYSVLNTDNPKFEKYNGLPYMSYSAYNSWMEDSYRGAFIAAKFLGIPDDGNIFTDFGSGCGEFLETKGMKVELKVAPLLSEFDIETLNNVVIPEDSEFERMIVLRRKDYVLMGYIDRCTRNAEAKLDVVDYKTGGAKKAKEYGGVTYNQTRLYSHSLTVEEGEEIGYVGVELLHRKGNNLIPGDKNVLRLEGTIEEVPTPYNPQETEFWLEGVDKVAHEISDNLTFYNKFFVD